MIALLTVKCINNYIALHFWNVYKSIYFWFVRVYLASIFALWKDDGFMCGAGGRWGENDSSVIFLQKTQNWLNRSLNVCSFWKYWRFSTALCRFPFPNISWRSNREPLIPFLPPPPLRQKWASGWRVFGYCPDYINTLFSPCPLPIQSFLNSYARFLHWGSLQNCFRLKLVIWCRGWSTNANSK